MKNQEEIIIDVLEGMKGIGGVPSNEEFYTEFEMRVKTAFGLADVSGIFRIKDNYTKEEVRKIALAFTKAATPSEFIKGIDKRFNEVWELNFGNQ